MVSCVGGVAGIHKSITRTAWSCADDGDAIGISRGSVRVGASGVFLTVCCWSGGRAGATKNADRRHFSENGGGNGRGGGGDGREGWGLGRGSRTRVVVREMSRVALVRARLGDVSARRKWRLGNSETVRRKFASRSGRARCYACPREGARPTNRVLPSTARVWTCRSQPSGRERRVCSTRSAAPSEIGPGGTGIRNQRMVSVFSGERAARDERRVRCRA